MVHNIPRLIQFRGGNVKFIQSLDDHFNGGHNEHTNEVRLPTDEPTYMILIIIAVTPYSLPVFPCWSSLQISRKGEGDSTRELQ